MTPGARIQAAIEVLDEIAAHRRPAADALREWGRAHRFAGSSDRAAIGNIVFDALRRRNSIAARVGEDGPRALALGATAFSLGIAVEEIATWCGTPHAPEALSTVERQALAASGPDDLPPWIAGDYPEWLHPSFGRAFGSSAVEEGRALSVRAPVDLRVNTLKSTREKVFKALARFSPEPTPLSPIGIRIAAPEAFGRTPNVEREPAHERGHFEIQDEGSQLAALLAGAAPGMQVLDLCAGSGGKTLALAAAMDNTGQIHAHDADASRLKPIFERLKRAGVRNCQVIGAHEGERLAALEGRMDLVLVDAPCSGTGRWRRHPDAKWRLSASALEQRRIEQRLALEQGARHVRPGGRLAYVTCSVLPEENGDQVQAFLGHNPDFHLLPYGPAWLATVGSPPPASPDGSENTLLLTPRRHGTDGFFIALLARGTNAAG